MRMGQQLGWGRGHHLSRRRGRHERRRGKSGRQFTHRHNGRVVKLLLLLLLLLLRLSDNVDDGRILMRILILETVMIEVDFFQLGLKLLCELELSSVVVLVSLSLSEAVEVLLGVLVPLIGPGPKGVLVEGVVGFIADLVGKSVAAVVVLGREVHVSRARARVQTKTAAVAQ